MAHSRPAGSSWRGRLRAEGFPARFLPRGPLDLLRQLGLFAGAYYLYRLVRS